MIRSFVVFLDKEKNTNMSTKRMTLTAMTSCIIIISSWITIPFAVPFSMQTFAVFFSLLLLGGKDGFISVCLYILLGAIGLPVFSGFRGGIGHLIGPTGGYIFGFVLLAFLYMLSEPIILKKKSLKPFVLFAGLVLCYTAGTFWYSLMYKGNEYNEFWEIASVCVFPYVIFDLIKLWLAFFTVKRVKNLLELRKIDTFY